MCMYVCIYVSTEIYFKKLAHAIVELDKSKICKVDLQTGGKQSGGCSDLTTIC